MSEYCVNGAGNLFAHYITLFDLTYSEYVTGAHSESKRELSELLKSFEDLRDSVGAERLIKNSEAALKVWYERHSPRDGAAGIAGEYVARHFGLGEGEARFLCAYCINELYACYLRADAVDTLLPPDLVKTQKLLQKKCGVKYADTLKTVDFSGANGYFRLAYIVREYREDLARLLTSFDMKSKQRYFRRLYDDAGFSLKNRVNTKELLYFIALAGGLAENTFLGFLKKTGFLEVFM